MVLEFPFDPERVCVLRLSAIGDVCHTLPVIRTLQQHWPQTQFTWLIGELEATLIGDIPDIEFLVLNKSAGWRGMRELSRVLRGRRFDLLLHMHPSMRANLLSLAVTATHKLGFDRARAKNYQWCFSNKKIPPKARQHVMDGLFEFAEYLGAARRLLQWNIPLDTADREFAQAQRIAGRSLMLISPCSSERRHNFRNWSAENYAAVVQHCAQRHGMISLITGGSSTLEKHYGEEICRLSGADAVNLVGKTSLKQLLALIEVAHIVVCPDSGPAHMATAVGTPVVGLFATSNPRRTGPYFSQSSLINRYPEAVAAEFHSTVEAIPWGQRVRNPQAMLRISVSEVTSAIDRVVSTTV